MPSSGCTDAAVGGAADSGGMTARQVEEASIRLRELRIQYAEDLALAVAAAGFALGATQVSPVLAVPLLVGAVGLGALGIRAFVRRALLVEDLAADEDAYRIDSVRRYAARVASPDGRRQLAHALRADPSERLAAARTELDALAAVLEDERTPIEPHDFVALDRWIHDPAGTFRDPSVPAVELRSRLRRILLDLDGRAP